MRKISCAYTRNEKSYAYSIYEYDVSITVSIIQSLKLSPKYAVSADSNTAWTWAQN